MLINLREYHRPTGGDREREVLDQVLALLARPDVRTVPLAGGDTLIGSAGPALQAVVDLQGLGLDGITGESSLEIGAMTTRAALASNEASQKVFGGLLAEGARRWGGSVQRNRATVGGAVAVAAPTDPLLAALLVCDATVVLYTGEGYREVSLANFLPRRAHWLATPVLIVRLRLAPAHGQTGAALATVSRTPADAPIVLAAAAIGLEGDRCVIARLAVGGASANVQRLDRVEASLTGQALTGEAIAEAARLASEVVEPAGDFRGSAEYRRAMAGVLARRALHEARARVA